ncbi:hypothetical protein, partial [Thiolapillus sp.]|uniref:hypothetical protein n=1 Tax=Thiolapillus sp. TaxID=2017437 RepID=UPI003AF525FF
MCKFCWTVLLLLLLAIGAAVYKFGFVGSVVQAPDGRQALQLTTAERNMVLGEMRDFLVAVQAIIAATNTEDMAAAAAAARKVGMAAQTAVPPALIGKLPLTFKKLGFAAHCKRPRIDTFFQNTISHRLSPVPPQRRRMPWPRPTV